MVMLLLMLLMMFMKHTAPPLKKLNKSLHLHFL